MLIQFANWLREVSVICGYKGGWHSCPLSLCSLISHLPIVGCIHVSTSLWCVCTCRSRGGWSSSPLPLCCLGSHLLDVGLVDRQQDVLWLDVCMDDLTLGVKVVQALENLQEGRGSVRPRLYRRVSTLRKLLEPWKLLVKFLEF